MKMRGMRVVVLGLVAGFLTACAPRDTSPVIACELNGAKVSTAFTFNSFRTTLSMEHGAVEVVTNRSLKSKSIQIDFTPLADGRLLAERVMVLGATSHDMAPAVLFGLTNAMPSAAVAPVPPAATP